MRRLDYLMIFGAIVLLLDTKGIESFALPDHSGQHDSIEVVEVTTPDLPDLPDLPDDDNSKERRQIQVEALKVVQETRSNVERISSSVQPVVDDLSIEVTKEVVKPDSIKTKIAVANLKSTNQQGKQPSLQQFEDRDDLSREVNDDILKQKLIKIKGKSVNKSLKNKEMIKQLSQQKITLAQHQLDDDISLEVVASTRKPELRVRSTTTATTPIQSTVERILLKQSDERDDISIEIIGEKTTTRGRSSTVVSRLTPKQDLDPQQVSDRIQQLVSRIRAPVLEKPLQFSSQSDESDDVSIEIVRAASRPVSPSVSTVQPFFRRNSADDISVVTFRRPNFRTTIDAPSMNPAILVSRQDKSDERDDISIEIVDRVETKPRDRVVIRRPIINRRIFKQSEETPQITVPVQVRRIVNRRPIGRRQHSDERDDDNVSIEIVGLLNRNQTINRENSEALNQPISTPFQLRRVVNRRPVSRRQHSGERDDDNISIEIVGLLNQNQTANLKDSEALNQPISTPVQLRRVVNRRPVSRRQHSDERDDDNVSIEIVGLLNQNQTMNLNNSDALVQPVRVPVQLRRVVNRRPIGRRQHSDERDDDNVSIEIVGILDQNQTVHVNNSEGLSQQISRPVQLRRVVNRRPVGRRLQSDERFDDVSLEFVDLSNQDQNQTANLSQLFVRHSDERDDISLEIFGKPIQSNPVEHSLIEVVDFVQNNSTASSVQPIVVVENGDDVSVEIVNISQDNTTASDSVGELIIRQSNERDDLSLEDGVLLVDDGNSSSLIEGVLHFRHSNERNQRDDDISLELSSRPRNRPAAPIDDLFRHSDERDGDNVSIELVDGHRHSQEVKVSPNGQLIIQQSNERDDTSLEFISSQVNRDGLVDLQNATVVIKQSNERDNDYSVELVESVAPIEALNLSAILSQPLRSRSDEREDVSIEIVDRNRDVSDRGLRRHSDERDTSLEMNDRVILQNLPNTPGVSVQVEHDDVSLEIRDRSDERIGRLPSTGKPITNGQLVIKQSHERDDISAEDIRLVVDPIAGRGKSINVVQSSQLNNGLSMASALYESQATAGSASVSSWLILPLLLAYLLI